MSQSVSTTAFLLRQALQVVLGAASAAWAWLVLRQQHVERAGVRQAFLLPPAAGAPLASHLPAGQQFLLCCVVLPHAAAAGTGSGAEGDETMSAALHKVVHEVLGDDLTLAEAKQMLAEVDARNAGKLSLSEVRTGDRTGLLRGCIWMCAVHLAACMPAGNCCSYIALLRLTPSISAHHCDMVLLSCAVCWVLLCSSPSW
jgi:hypothetical protein